MFKRIAAITFFVLVPLSTFATRKVKDSKGKETMALQVVTSKTRINSSSERNIFAYTDLMFTQFNGKKIVYECIQHGDICPMVESGQTYTAERDGAYIHITMTFADEQKPIAVKYKQVGTW
jgi:hypothetical protein